MNFIFDHFDLFFNGSLILFAVMFVFVIYTMFSKKGRSRFIGRQLDITRTVLEDNKDLIKDLGELGGNIAAQTQRAVYENNEEDLMYNARKGADIEAEAIRRKARAFKEGLGDLNFGGTSAANDPDPQKYCKYCGASIDADSLYCNKCGERQ